MSDSITEVRTPTRSQASDAEIVAVVLSDGTVRTLPPETSPEATAAWEWDTGHITGRNWILWWERRRWSGDR